MRALRDIIDDVILAFGPLVYTAQDPQRFKDLLADLGWTVTSVPQPLLDFATAGSDLVGTIEADRGEISPTHLIDSVKRLVDAIDGIRTKPDAAFPSGIDAASFKATIGRDLLDYFIVEHLLRNRYKIGYLFKLAGIVGLVETPAIGQRQPYLKRQVLWSRIGELITDPVKGFSETFDWNSPTPRLAQAISDLASLLESYGLQLSYFRSKGDQLAFVNGGTTVPLDDPLGIDLFFDDAFGAPDGFEAGIQFLLRPPTTARGPALSLLPYARLNGAQEVALSETLSLSIHGDADFTQGVAFTLAPGHPPEVQAGFLGGTAVSPADCQVRLKVTPRADEPERLLIGTADASRLSIKTVCLSAGARLISSDKLDAFVALDFENARVVIKPAPGEADSFLASFLGEDGISASLSFGLQLSDLTGFHLTGAGGLEGSFPVNVQLGRVDVEALSIGLKPRGRGVDLEVGAAVSGSLGPLTVVIERAGFKLRARFPDPPTGNLGPLDVSFGFLPPKGAGLSINATGVSGGGFLLLDQEKGQYAGVVQLNIEGGITVSAIGLISTRLPNGAKGFSFVVMITAQGFKPIQLGLGFTLTAIGGLLAINRTCNEEFLREGIKNNTLKDLLFPKDPALNAPQIFGALNNAFPSRVGSYLFGPVVQISWGTPPILTMDLGLILEFGNRKRLIILGRVSAIMPSEKHDLIRLQMNAFGVIDFDQRSISLDAILYNSRLAGKFPITGSMAMRLRWGSAPVFALSIGGFHPAFKPPPSFPVLKRLAISLSDTENFRLRIECYLAITSNTLQFGAKVELMARAGRFSIEGRLSFDVLIQFDPFFFLADFQASVQLKLHSHNLFSVDVKGQLSGPRPLHIKGKATFGIFWCHFSVRFDKTLVEGERPPHLEGLNVLEQLKAALNDSRNWSGQLAEGERRAVTLREVAGTDLIALHPLGRLSVKQNVVPLEVEISRFGNTTPAGARLFTINSLTLDGNETKFSREKDFFAPAQFLDLSEDEKLAAPSFEAMIAGISAGAESFLFTPNEADILKDANIIEDNKIVYETIIVDKEFEAENPKPRKSPGLFFINADFLDRNISLGAAACSDIRRTGSAKYRLQPTGDESQGHPVAGKNSLDKKGWTIASTEDGSHQGAPGLEAGKVVSYSESFQVLQKLKRENPAKAKTLMLVRVSAS